jgi:hypothetical protein
LHHQRRLKSLTNKKLDRSTETSGKIRGSKTMKCILVLAANPQSTDRLELEREAAIIGAQLAKGRYGKDFEVRTEIGVRIEDLRRYLSEYQPTIVHVVGQGSATGEILWKLPSGSMIYNSNNPMVIIRV